MTELSEMPNIGKKLAEYLNQANIGSAEELENMGSREAFKRLRCVREDACLNMLCALEGAVRGVRWHHLPQEIKQELKEYNISLNNRQ